MFTTGYAANLGLIGALVGPGDAAVVDSAAHASLVDGARFSDGTLRAFRHNRPNSLRRTLRSWREQPDAGGVLVAVDGIYSMEGDWAPLAGRGRPVPRLRRPAAGRRGPRPGRRRARRGRHGGGDRGPAGPGHGHVLQVAGQLRRVRRRTPGGHRLPEGHVPAADVHRVGVPAALAAALEAARIAQTEDWRREAVMARAEQLAHRAWPTLATRWPTATESPIVAVQVGDNWDAGPLWKALLEHGVYTNCAIPPAVPRAMLRTSVMATHTEADIDRALDGFADRRPAAREAGGAASQPERQPGAGTGATPCSGGRPWPRSGR